MERTLPNLPHLPPLGVSMSILASEVPEVGVGVGVPEWVKVTPRGTADTRDGRRYGFSPETLAARFKADRVDVPVDLNHSIILKGGKGEAADAIGWAKEIEARPDGTYARIEWLPAGKAILAAKSHRYVSPTFFPDEAGNATWLHSIALLAAPALSMPALAGARPGGTGDKPSTIRQALGLDAGADEAACLAAIGVLQNEFVPLGLYADTLASLHAANAALATQRGEARSERLGRMLEDALNAGKMFPFERDHYVALCSTDAGLERVALLLANKPSHGLFTRSGLDGKHPDRSPENALKLADRAQRYRAARLSAGATLSVQEAVTHCAANPSAGQ